jgi:putative colanic acid biosynthesis glycosyltransferase
MRKPLISLITPTLNDIQNLKKLLKNLKKQTFKNFEHIIADGGSTDGTVEYLKANKSVNKIITSKDLNMYKGINKALDSCEGQVIGYINSDDQYNDYEYFKKIAYYFSKEKFDCLYSGYKVIDKENKIEKVYIPLKFKSRYLITLGMTFCQHSFFWNSKFKKKKFNLNYKICSDFQFIGNIMLNSKKIIYIQSITSSFFKYKNSFGSKNHKKGLSETKKIKKSFFKKIKHNRYLFILDRILNYLSNFQVIKNNVYILKYK